MKKMKFLKLFCFSASICFLMLSPLASSIDAQTNSFAGQYSGKWLARFVNGHSATDGKTEYTGTWNVTITSDGEVSGSEYNDDFRVTNSFSGDMDDDGYIKVYLKEKTRTSIIRGQLRQRGNSLKGILEQLCDDGVPCLAIEITLTRSSSAEQNPGKINSNVKSGVEENIKKGDEYADKGMWSAAETEYAQAVELEPDNSLYWFKLWFSVYRQGILNPSKSSEQFLAESKTLRKAKKFDMKILVSTLTEAAAKEPKTAFKYKELGHLLYLLANSNAVKGIGVDNEKLGKSKEAFITALKLNPKDGEANLYLGFIAERNGLTLSASKYFGEACKLGITVVCQNNVNNLK